MDSGTLWQVPVTYGGVGGTKAEDLLRYPPAGYRPIERRVRIGHGQARWQHAWVETMSWGIQRRSGFKVRVLEAPDEVTAATYTPVAFADDGTPIQPATTGEAGEVTFAADGTELVKPGDTAFLKWMLWPWKIPARVVYVVDEPARKGFAYGTLPGHPERGEESFVVEYRDDDSVWLIIRAFSRPSNAFFWVTYPALRLLQAIFTNRYEHSLTGPIEGE